NGGRVPLGIRRSIAWLIAVTWAVALAMFTPGWKYTLMRPTPLNDCDSMCSMSLTVVVIERSETKIMRVDISCGERPIKFHTTVIIGMSMSGKISVGIVSILNTPRIKISSAKTTKV